MGGWGTFSVGSLLTCTLRYFQQWIQDLNTGEYGGSPACSLPRKESMSDPLNDGRWLSQGKGDLKEWLGAATTHIPNHGCSPEGRGESQKMLGYLAVGGGEPTHRPGGRKQSTGQAELDPPGPDSPGRVPGGRAAHLPAVVHSHEVTNQQEGVGQHAHCNLKPRET